jgi:hypothetical protein
MSHPTARVKVTTTKGKKMIDTLQQSECSVCGWTLGKDVPALAERLDPMCYECADDMGIIECNGCGIWDDEEDMIHHKDMELAFCQSCAW